MPTARPAGAAEKAHPGSRGLGGLDKKIVARDPRKPEPKPGEEEEEPDQMLLVFQSIAFGLWEVDEDLAA